MSGSYIGGNTVGRLYPQAHKESKMPENKRCNHVPSQRTPEKYDENGKAIMPIAEIGDTVIIHSGKLRYYYHIYISPNQSEWEKPHLVKAVIGKKKGTIIYINKLRFNIYDIIKNKNIDINK